MQRRIVIATGAAAALALALAAPAGAATVKGTVVHKDKRHHRFVVAQRAAATAVTPTPLAQGVPGRPATGAAERLAELAAGAAGSASAAGMAIKAGAVIAVTGAVAAGLGGGAARDHVRTPGGPASGAPSLSRATRSPRAAPGPPRRAESLTCDLPETPARPDGSCAGPRATAQATRASPLRGAGAAAERTTRIRGTSARTGDGPADGTTAAGGHEPDERLHAAPPASGGRGGDTGPGGTAPGSGQGASGGGDGTGGGQGSGGGETDAAGEPDADPAGTGDAGGGEPPAPAAEPAHEIEQPPAATER